MPCADADTSGAVVVDMGVILTHAGRDSGIRVGGLGFGRARSHPDRRRRHAPRRTAPTTYPRSSSSARIPRRSAGRRSRCRTRSADAEATSASWCRAAGPTARAGPSLSRPRAGSPGRSTSATRATDRADLGYGSHPWARGTGYVERGAAPAARVGLRRPGPAHGHPGVPTSATGRRAGSPGGSASPSRARSGSGRRSAASSATSGSARCCATTRASRARPGSTTR